MQNTRLIIIILISVLLAGNILFGVLYFLSHTESLKLQDQFVAQQINGKVLFFAQLFIDKVLLGEGMVGFEDRLKLENAVRDIDDDQIFSLWQKFTDSKGDQESQNAVGRLLKTLFDKVQR